MQRLTSEDVNTFAHPQLDQLVVVARDGSKPLLTDASCLVPEVMQGHLVREG